MAACASLKEKILNLKPSENVDPALDSIKDDDEKTQSTEQLALDKPQSLYVEEQQVTKQNFENTIEVVVPIESPDGIENKGEGENEEQQILEQNIQVIEAKVPTESLDRKMESKEDVEPNIQRNIKAEVDVVPETLDALENKIENEENVLKPCNQNKMKLDIDVPIGSLCEIEEQRAIQPSGIRTEESIDVGNQQSSEQIVPGKSEVHTEKPNEVADTDQHILEQIVPDKITVEETEQLSDTNSIKAVTDSPTGSLCSKDNIKPNTEMPMEFLLASSSKGG